MGKFQLNKKGDDPIKIYEDVFKISQGTVESHLGKLGKQPKPISREVGDTEDRITKSYINQLDTVLNLLEDEELAKPHETLNVLNQFTQVEAIASEVPISDSDTNGLIWTCPKCSQQINYDTVMNKKLISYHLRSMHGLSDEQVGKLNSQDFQNDWEIQRILRSESKASELSDYEREQRRLNYEEELTEEEKSTQASYFNKLHNDSLDRKNKQFMEDEQVFGEPEEMYGMLGMESIASEWNSVEAIASEALDPFEKDNIIDDSPMEEQLYDLFDEEGGDGRNEWPQIRKDFCGGNTDIDSLVSGVSNQRSARGIKSVLRWADKIFKSNESKASEARKLNARQKKLIEEWVGSMSSPPMVITSDDLPYSLLSELRDINDFDGFESAIMRYASDLGNKQAMQGSNPYMHSSNYGSFESKASEFYNDTGDAGRFLETPQLQQIRNHWDNVMPEEEKRSMLEGMAFLYKSSPTQKFDSLNWEVKESVALSVAGLVGLSIDMGTLYGKQHLDDLQNMYWD